MRQPYGPGDTIEIDVIDADPGVFGPSAAPASPRVRRPRPRWLVPTAVGVVTLCGGIALVWRPWEHPPEWRTFGPAAPAASSLSDQLILDLPGATVTGVQAGQNLDADEPTPLGHVFAVPGGSYESDPWALFHSRGSNSAGKAQVSESTDLVRGLPAVMRSARVRTTLTWGPIGGNYWDSETHRLDDDDALEFANAVGVVAGLPAVEYSHDLGSLEPLGDVKTLARVQVLTAYVDNEPILSKFTPMVLTYEIDGTPVTVAAISTDTDGLAMARFFLGHGRDVTVRGLPGALIETRRIGKVVVWHEGDRLVVVAADGPDAQLLDIAQAVRPATSDEWNEVLGATALASPDSGDSWIFASHSQPIGAGTTSYNVAWQASITAYSVVCVHNMEAEGSSEESCVYTTPLSPSTDIVVHEGLRATFVAAVAPTGNQVLRITSTFGAFEDFEPVALNATTEAVVALLPEGATYELVDPAALK